MTTMNRSLQLWSLVLLGVIVALGVTGVAAFRSATNGGSPGSSSITPARHRRTPNDHAHVDAGSVETVRFFSHTLGRSVTYVIYLPPGYGRSRRTRYPVLYLLHAPPGSPRGFLTAGDLPATMDALLAARRAMPFLVVMPDAHTNVDGDDTEWANAEAGPYESFVIELVSVVDDRWATIRTRAARAIGGISTGGYGATNIALHHLATFGMFESWSGYFVQTPTDSFTHASQALLRANSPDDYVGALTASLRRYRLDAFIYRGNDDDTTARQQAEFVTRLRRAGASVHAATYPGVHSWTLWRREMPTMLSFASHFFAAPSATTTTVTAGT